MKTISIEWRLNRHNDENSTWKFGNITDAELSVLHAAREIKFDHQTWTVGSIFTTWGSEEGIMHVVTDLFER